MHSTSEAAEPGGGGHWGQVPLHFLYLGKSALFGQCPLTFEVLPRPLLYIIILFYSVDNARQVYASMGVDLKIWHVNFVVVVNLQAMPLYEKSDSKFWCACKCPHNIK